MDVPNGKTINEGCPTRETWVDFYLGKPDFDAQDALLGHLEICPQCQATLTDLGDVRDELTDGLRQPLEDDPRVREPAFLRLRARLAALDPSASPEIAPAPVPRAHRDGQTLEQLGRYQILGKLGQGGFGLVYLAFDTQLRQKVALKMPRDRGLLSPAGNHAFAWEGRAAAGLDHPHILRIYDAGEIDGIPYITSAYCAGPTLARWLKDRAEPVPARMAAQLVVALASAVQHAHSRGVLHRDLKPSNILLSPLAAGDSGADIEGFAFVPKITDFGLAKVFARGMTDPDHAPTETGAILGTPGYMAPEQASGRSREADIRTDVYGLVRAALLPADGPPAVPGRDAAGNPEKGRERRARAVGSAEARPAARPGNHLPEVSGQASGSARMRAPDSLPRTYAVTWRVNQSRPADWAGPSVFGSG